MSRLKATIIILMSSFFFVPNILYAWDDKKTHPDLSEMASKISVLGAQDYLKNIGFSKGLDETVNNKKVFEWFREGAFLEDSVVWYELITNRGRFNNHFHNPLKQWWSAGLDDYLILPSPVPPYTYSHHVFGLSSVLWAQDSTYQESFREGDQSWKKIREHYYTALTGKDFTGTEVAPYKEKREEYFARTFRGLGHQIHLIQDAAQPDHVRNDAHPEDSLLEKNYLTGAPYFETWAKKNPGIINSFASKAKDFMPQVSLNISKYGLVPITQFIDAEQYNTGTIPSNSFTWGISEYTNSNFVSDDTIFTENFSQSDRHYFPYPRYSTQCYELYDKDIGANKKRTYLRKKCEGEPVERFAAPGPFFKYLGLFAPSLQRLDLILDAGAHYDYADKLIPRAVGYSAGLLNYFFRGEMDMIPDDATGSGYVIVNNTDEDMSGTFELWYDNTSDNRIKLQNWSLSINKKSSGNNKSTNITLTTPPDAKEPGKYMLVFSGRLGNEEGAVVGKEISLIPPLVFLIYQDAQNNPVYAVWSIENDGKTLKDYKFDISKYAKYFNIYNYRNPSTVKSDDNYQNHVYTMENSKINNISQPQYGKQIQGVLVGVRNSFEKEGFDYGMGYIGYSGNYICSGRNSSYVDVNGRKITNLELWKIDSTHGTSTL